jgi:ElaB/YqjD/DUF883 family membrane-anchored ribosome-binding protein
MSDTVTSTPEQRLMDDLRTLIDEGEGVLRAATNEAMDASADARARLTAQVERARARLAELEQAAEDRARAAARATDTWVRDNPWQAVGVAVGAGIGVGLIVGLLIGRK